MAAGPRIFVAHSRDDAPAVLRLVRSLQQAGLPVWAEAMIRLGDRWADLLEDALQSSDVYVVVASPSALASDFTMFEIGVALGRADTAPGVRVIPVLTGGTGWADLPYHLRQHAGIDGTAMSPEDIGQAIADDLTLAAA